MSSARSARIADQIQRSLAELIRLEVRDPRVGLVTVTHLEVTPDLSLARVRVAVPGEDEQKRLALEGLRSAAGFLRSRAARTLATRTVPELRFELDRGIEHAQRIGEILEGLRREGELD